MTGMERKMNKRRGITLLETVIALTVILLVSGAGVSIAALFSKTEAKNLTQRQALSFGESIVECFRYCNGNDELEAALDLLDGEFAPVLSGDVEGIDGVSDGAFVAKLEKNGFIITVVSDYDQNKLEVQILYTNDGKMNKLNYEKS